MLSAVLSFRPMLSTVSIMPGMENFAPERQDTSRGFEGSPNFLAVCASTDLSASSSWSHKPSGNLLPSARYALQASVVAVKPGGTGTPMRVISARLAPLPPSRERTPSQLPPTYFSACSTSSNRYTHFFPDILYLLNQDRKDSCLRSCFL